MNEEHEQDPLKSEHCPNCDHPLTEPINDIWKDPMVKEALKDGRTPDDIAVLSCPECDRYGYYNQGSHFTCRFCNKTWTICDEDNHPLYPHMHANEMITLSDTVTEVTEGYHNETQRNS